MGKGIGKDKVGEGKGKDGAGYRVGSWHSRVDEDKWVWVGVGSVGGLGCV